MNSRLQNQKSKSKEPLEQFPEWNYSLPTFPLKTSILFCGDLQESKKVVEKRQSHTFHEDFSDSEHEHYDKVKAIVIVNFRKSKLKTKRKSFQSRDNSQD